MHRIRKRQFTVGKLRIQTEPLPGILDCNFPGMSISNPKRRE